MAANPLPSVAQIAAAHRKHRDGPISADDIISALAAELRESGTIELANACISYGEDKTSVREVHGSALDHEGSSSGIAYDSAWIVTKDKRVDGRLVRTDTPYATLKQALEGALF